MLCRLAGRRWGPLAENPSNSPGVGCRRGAPRARRQTLQLVDKRNHLVQLREAQAPRLRKAKQFRERLQALGSEAARLADGGHATAKKIVDAMRQQGVTLEAPEK